MLKQLDKDGMDYMGQMFEGNFCRVQVMPGKIGVNLENWEFTTKDFLALVEELKSVDVTKFK